MKLIESRKKLVCAILCLTALSFLVTLHYKIEAGWKLIGSHEGAEFQEARVFESVMVEQPHQLPIRTKSRIREASASDYEVASPNTVETLKKLESQRLKSKKILETDVEYEIFLVFDLLPKKRI